MAAKKEDEMFTAGKLADALQISQGKVNKLILAHEIEPDEIKHGCKYYGIGTLKMLKAEVNKL